MTPDQLALLQAKLAEWRKPVTGFPLFAKECLKVLDKSGSLVPFELNDPQWFFHEKIEAQRAKIGMVRCSVLKGRQQGISTYVAGRYYHRAVTRFGRKVYILSHMKASSDVLFGIVERFHKNNPFGPEIGENNASSMTFPGLESSYTVATAGAQEGGRGGGVNLFHGSEIGFWQNAESHFAASLQSVPMLPETEIIFESTSGGPTGKFYEQFKKGQQPDEMYESIFIPWFTSREYFFMPPTGFTLDTTPPDDVTGSEAEVAAAHNLSDGQMMWRRLKISELGLNRFNREYPTTEDDAWSSTDTDIFINPAAVLRARGRNTEASGPMILGVDPAGGGGDRFAVCERRGNKVVKLEWRNKIDIMEATEWLFEIIMSRRPDRVNIDSGNIGQALITNLRARDPFCAGVVRSIAFGTPSQSKMANKQRVGPENRRAEMWGRMKEWLENPENQADIPNIDELSSDLLAPSQIHRVNGDWLLESKSDMKKRGKRSPDLGDALALTFASKEYFPERAENRAQPTPLDRDYTPTPRPVYNEGPIMSPGGWMS